MKFNIDELIKSAMLERCKTKENAYKSLKSALVNLEKSGVSVTDAEVVKTIMKLVSQRQEAFDMYSKRGRIELANIEQDEKLILEALLPNESVEDIEAYTREVIGTYQEVSKKITGEVLKRVQERFTTANGQIVSKVLSEYL